MSYPTRYIVFDTETNTSPSNEFKNGVELRLRLGVAKFTHLLPTGSVVNRLEFRESRSFHNWVNSLPVDTDVIWVFAHNAGFDLRVVEFWKYLTSGAYDLFPPIESPKAQRFKEPFVVLENPPTMIRCWGKSGQEFMFVDTYQWIAHKLADIGKNLGFPKLEVDFDNVTDEDLMTYCHRDVEVLDLALNKIWAWLKGDGCKDFKPTRASQSRYIYKSQYEHNSIVYHDNESASSLERHAYYGGRTDLWYVGERKEITHQLDVNSLYPYVMMKKWFPCQLLEHGDGLKDVGRKFSDQAKAMTAEVWIDDPVGSWPVRCRDGTWFCRGKVHTVLSGPELSRAALAGVITRVGRFNRYRLGMLFDKYIKYYWDKRVEAKAGGDKVQDMIVKLLMNSLYGKFGQLTSDWVYSDSSLPIGHYGQGVMCEGDGHNPRKYRVIDGNVFLESERYESKGSFIAIPSFVTAYARERMETLKWVAQPGNYFYQATDSLYVSQAGFNNLTRGGWVDDGRIGHLKNEGSHDHMRFVNIHHLDKGDKQVRGSVRANAVRLGNDCFEVDVWESFKRSVIDQHLDHVLIRKIKKCMPGKYIRQRIDDDGSTTPWTINNWDVPLEDMKKTSLRRGSTHGE
jgi:hypothetical protein